MRKLLGAVCALDLVSALVLIGRLPLSAQQTIVNNLFSPFTTIKIIGSRPGPRPQWSSECNQGFTEWKPVCAVTRNRVAVTYPNQCMADLDGAIVFDPRECPREVSCPYTYEPVCARLNYPGRKPLKEALKPPPLAPFINECFARTLPDRVKGEVPPPEATDELKVQVTIIRTYGEDLHQYPKQTYRHYGRSGLEDFSQICPTTCPDGGLVVCAVDHLGEYRLFKNKCSAIRAGATPFKHGDLMNCK